MASTAVNLTPDDPIAEQLKAQICFLPEPDKERCESCFSEILNTGYSVEFLAVLSKRVNSLFHDVVKEHRNDLEFFEKSLIHLHPAMSELHRLATRFQDMKQSDSFMLDVFTETLKKNRKWKLKHLKDICHLPKYDVFLCSSIVKINQAYEKKFPEVPAVPAFPGRTEVAKSKNKDVCFAESSVNFASKAPFSRDTIATGSQRRTNRLYSVKSGPQQRNQINNDPADSLTEEDFNAPIVTSSWKCCGFTIHEVKKSGSVEWSCC